MMRVNLLKAYYYSFLAMFAVIVFSNLFPSDWVVVMRPFVFFVAILSIFLLNNTKAVIYLLLLYVFILTYTLYPLLTNSVNIQHLVNNTKYTIYLVFIFGLVNMMRFISLDRLLYNMSKIFIVKLLFIGMISLNMNFGGGWFAGYILDGIEINVHRLFGAYRVFDVYLFLFPLIFLYTKDKENIIKIMTHALLLFNIVSSATFGIIFPYIAIMLLKFNILGRVLFLLSGVIGFIYHDLLLDLYSYFLTEKSVSIEVKLDQFLFLIDNITLWGQGLGGVIDIQGRVGYMLENIYIYWVIVYGAIGTIFMIMFFVVFPFLICYRFKKEFPVMILFYMHVAILLASASNPFLESVIGIMPMMIIVSYFFSKNYSKQV